MGTGLKRGMRGVARGLSVFALLAGAVSAAYAADGDYVWAKQMGGSGSEYGRSIALDSSGNVYTTGRFGGTADFDPGAGTANLTPVGGVDIYVFKLDSSGAFGWAKQMGGSGNEDGLSVAVDSSGNVYTTGYFQGTVDFDPGAGTASLTAVGISDVFVSKLDSSGTFVWAKQMGGSSSEYGHSIALDSSGNVYTTGEFQGTADFDPGAGTANLTAVGNEDIFVSKLDSSGAFVWAKQMGGSSVEVGFSIALDSSGNVYTTGRFGGTADFDPGVSTVNLTAAGGNDIFVTKLDSSGAVVWAKQMGGSSTDWVESIALDSSGNVYTTGYFWGTADFDPGAGTANLTAAGSSDIFVSKLDSSGAFVWAKQMGGSGSEYGHSIALDASGNIYTTGDFWGTADFDPGAGTASLTAVGVHDIFVSKLDNSGTCVWAKQMGGSDYEYGLSVAVDANGNVYTTGEFWGTVDFDPGASTANLTSVNNADIFVVKLNGLAGPPTPVITAPNGGADYTTSSTAAAAISGTCDSTSTEIHVNGSASGVTYTPGDTTWSYLSGALSIGANVFSVTALDGVGESLADTITITVDVPTVVSIVRADANPTSASSVSFTVTFDSAVTGVDVSDFTLTTTGLGGASVSSVSADSGVTRTVTVNTGSGDGTIRLDVVDDDTIVDGASVPLGGAGTGNGDFAIGEVYAIDKVYSYSSQFGTSGSGNGQLSSPDGITAASSGDLYVSDAGNNRIQEFTSAGVYVTKWGSSGSGTSQFLSPRGNTVDGSVNVYVADVGNNRVQVFTSSGTYVMQWGGSGSGNGQFAGPHDVAIDSLGAVYVADLNNNRVQKFTSTGTYVTQWGGVGSGDGQFSTPRGIAVDSSDNVYVADTGNNRIQKFTSAGTFVSKWGTSGSGDGQFDTPYGVTVDVGGKVIVADTGNNRFQVFTSAGAFVKSRGTLGSGEGQLNFPTAVDTDSSGNVYVADTGNNRIQKFTGDPATAVVSITRSAADPSAASSVTFAVTFNNAVTGVDLGDFTLTTTGVSGASVTSVSADSGATRTVTVNTGSGDGTIRLDVVDDDSIVDATADPLGGPGTGNGNFTTGEVYTMDRSAPTAPDVSGTTPTNDTTPTWSWTAGGGGNGTFRYQMDSEAGAWTETTDLSYTPGSPLSEAAHTLYVQERDIAGNWSTSGSFAITIDTTEPNAPVVFGTSPTNDTTPEWSWSSGGGGGNGTYRYDLDASASWTYTLGTTFTPGAPLSAGAHTLVVQERDAVGNWSTDGSFAITIDATAPTLDISAPSSSITATGPVTFTVSYTGADSVILADGDVSLNTTGTANATVGVSGSGNATRTVSLSSITGNGTLGISIAANTASDTAGNQAEAAGPSATFQVDNTAIAVNIGAPSTTLTKSGPVDYTITYDNVTSVSLDDADVSLVPTGTATGTIQVTGAKAEGTQTRTVTISGISGTGTLAFSIASGTATDNLSNSAPEAGPSGSFTVDNTKPVITLQGGDPVNVDEGEVYTDAGATASDNIDGDLSGSIVDDSNLVDTDTPGSYTVTYNVTDAAGNAADSVTRTVNVVSIAPAVPLAPWPLVGVLMLSALAALRRRSGRNS